MENLLKEIEGGKIYAPGWLDVWTSNIKSSSSSIKSIADFSLSQGRGKWITKVVLLCFITFFCASNAEYKDDAVQENANVVQQMQFYLNSWCFEM